MADDDREIRAAGAVLWRAAGSGVEVALVHRPRYDDWSFPKGKCQRGEHILLAAVREVAEETGVPVILGRRLATTSYESMGRPKRVDYWAARAAHGPVPGRAGSPVPGGPFVANAEVDRLDWLAVPAARQRLSYQHDRAVLDDFAAKPAASTALVLLRHAAALSKSAWRAAGNPDDLARPLDGRGLAEAGFLGSLLGCYEIGQVISSVAERCVATVRPYAALAGAGISIEPGFSAGQNGAGQNGAVQEEAGRRRLARVIGAGEATVICAHRENLPALLAEACEMLGAKPPDGPGLHKGAFWVLQAAEGRLLSAERHDPAGV